MVPHDYVVRGIKQRWRCFVTVNDMNPQG